MKRYSTPDFALMTVCLSDILTESLGDGDFGEQMPSDWVTKIV